MSVRMKNYIKKAALLMFLLSLLQSGAQAPGYMGKRLVLGYGLYVNPAFNSVVLNYSDSPINAVHEFFLECATGKKFSLGFAAQLYKYTYNNIQDVDAIGYGSNHIKQQSAHPNGSYLITGRNYRLYGKFYKNRYLAPWGKYFLLGLTINTYKSSYDPSSMYVLVDEQGYPSSNITTRRVDDFGPTVQSYLTPDLFFGAGNSRIFANRIVLDYGYTISTIALTRILVGISDPIESSSAANYIPDTSLGRVSAINRFNFYLKLGYLF